MMMKKSVGGKKGELQIQETVLVLFIFFIILSMVLVVIYRYTNSSIESARNELKDNEVFSLLISLPTQFGYTYLSSDNNAIDTSRLFNLNLSYLSYKRILVEQTYPSGNNITCNFENYPNCDEFVLYNKQSRLLKNKIVREVPVSLYFPLTNEFKAGRLVVESYY